MSETVEIRKKYVNSFLSHVYLLLMFICIYFRL